MEIAELDEIRTSAHERTDRMKQEITGRLLVMVFIGLLIAFSYF